MASSKVILVLHCTVLVQLSFFVIEGVYNFSECNFSNIKTDYSDILKVLLETPIATTAHGKKSSRELSAAEKAGALLACIHNFTAKCVGAQHAELTETTLDVLEKRCPHYTRLQKDEYQNITVKADSNSVKCMKRRRSNSCGNVLLELKAMWSDYRRIRY